LIGGLQLGRGCTTASSATGARGRDQTAGVIGSTSQHGVLQVF
jgi:hypothetical protein